MPSYKKYLYLNLMLVSVVALGGSGCDKADALDSAQMSSSSVSNMEDSSIIKNLNIAFSKEEILSDANIEVSTENGKILLSGYVDNQEQHDLLLSLTKDAAGVYKVEDKITVREFVE